MPSELRQPNLHNVFSFADWKIRSKILSFVMAAILLITAGLTAFNYLTLSQNTTNLTGQALSEFAHGALTSSTEVLNGNLKALTTLALSPAVVQAVQTANQAYAGRDQAQIDAEIAKLDQAWKDQDPVVGALVNGIAQNAVSAYLRAFQTTIPGQVEVFVTDRQGLNVAMTDRTSDYLQADEGWWTGAFHDGQGAVYVSDAEYDESSQTWALDIGIPIRAEGGQDVIGVLRGTVDVSTVFANLQALNFGQTGHVVLLNRSGTIVYGRDPDLWQKQAPDSITALLQEGTDTWRSGVIGLGEKPSIVALHFMPGELGERTGWVFMAQQDSAEVNAVVLAGLMRGLLVAGLLAVGLGAVGLWVARSIAMPLTAATRQAQRLAQGDVQEADTALKGWAGRGDEVGGLLRAFQNLRDYMHGVAGTAAVLAKGDLTVAVNPRSDEDALGHAFGQMIADWRRLMREVTKNANSVNMACAQMASAAGQAGQATSQIATTIQQVARGTQQQAQSVTQTAGSVEQMRRAIDGVARGAQEQAAAVGKASSLTAQITAAVQTMASRAQAGAQGSAQAAQTARSGVQTVQDTIRSMDGIKARVAVSAGKVKEMGGRSDQIGAIVETIDDIASQTNLLALNAAIEAARAGEHGKGFAVVADEVRKLAERASGATKEIGGLIRGIQASAGEAVTAMDQSVAEVEAGAARAQASGRALAEILTAVETVRQGAEESAQAAGQAQAAANELVGAMDTVSAVVEENTASTEEMAAGSSEVTHAIENIASVSEENSAAVEQVSASAEEMSAQVDAVTASAQSLRGMAQALEQVVAQFQLGTEAAAGSAPPADPATTIAPARVRANGHHQNGRRMEDLSAPAGR